MRKYETIFILQPDLAEDDVKTITDKVQDVVASYKGDFHRLDDWGSRKLAYQIRKFPRGRYFYLRFDGEAALVAELERRLRLDEKSVALPERQHHRRAGEESGRAQAGRRND